MTEKRVMDKDQAREHLKHSKPWSDPDSDPLGDILATAAFADEIPGEPYVEPGVAGGWCSGVVRKESGE